MTGECFMSQPGWPCHRHCVKVLAMRVWCGINLESVTACFMITLYYYLFIYEDFVYLFDIIDKERAQVGGVASRGRSTRPAEQGA